MNTKSYVQKNKTFLIVGGLVLIILISFGLKRDSDLKNRSSQNISPTPASQSATLTPVSSASATPTIITTPTVTYRASVSSYSAQQPHPTK